MTWGGGGGGVSKGVVAEGKHRAGCADLGCAEELVVLIGSADFADYF